MIIIKDRKPRIKQVSILKKQLLLWATLLLFGLLLTETVLAEPRTALVIGNAAYSDNPLANPVNDAKDIAKALQGMGFTVTLRENLQKRAMEEVISEFSRSLQQQRGVGLFFYSGHGAQVNGRNYLIPVGATVRSEADVVYEAVDAGRLLDHMEEAGNSLNIIILDACRDNPFGRGFRSTRGGGLTRGLAQMEAPEGSIVAYSTAPGRVAEDGSGRNSPYTSALLAVMGTPGLGIEQVFKQVRNRVRQVTGNKQIPWESTSLMGDFYFVAAQAAAPPAEVPQPAPVLPSAPPAVSQPLPKPSSRVTPGQVFRDTLKDGSQGPEMVMIPAGSFSMGSPPNEPGRNDDERQHKVKVKAFAIGKYEVTFEEYDRFAEATGRDKPNDEGWGRGRRPVILVSWYDAVAYAEWLSVQTGQHYRLPTEAEWEYAARARTTTPFYFGNTINTDQANYNGNYTYGGGPKGIYREKTVEVGRFSANPWGLFDVHGNVWEWTCSVYDENYGGGEQRCAEPNTSSPCVLRGGSWSLGPEWLRGAARLWDLPLGGYFSRGFRLARTLGPKQQAAEEEAKRQAAKATKQPQAENIRHKATEEAKRRAAERKAAE